MQFTQDSIDKILTGIKTQTRRPAKSIHLGEIKKFPSYFVFEKQGEDYLSVADTNTERIIYAVGKTYAMCPGRGKSQVARIKLLAIAREDEIGRAHV